MLKTICFMRNELVFRLKWSVHDVEAMTLHQLAYWFGQAHDFYKNQND